MTNRYPYDLSSIRFDRFVEEASSAVGRDLSDPTKGSVLWRPGIPESAVVVETVDPLSAPEIQALDAVVATHDPAEILDDVVREQTAKTDRVASSKIESGTGFEHPTGSGKFFSSSIPAQVKWLQWYQNRAMLSYPVEVPTRDDSEIVAFSSAPEIEDAFESLSSRIYFVLDRAADVKAKLKTVLTPESAVALVDDFEKIP